MATFVLATKGRTLMAQYKSLRTAKTWGRRIGADHLHVVEIIMSGNHPSLNILQTWTLSTSATRYWTRF